jgi:hypothetical protein
MCSYCTATLFHEQILEPTVRLTKMKTTACRIEDNNRSCHTLSQLFTMLACLIYLFITMLLRFVATTDCANIFEESDGSSGVQTRMMIADCVSFERHLTRQLVAVGSTLVEYVLQVCVLLRSSHDMCRDRATLSSF